MSSFNPVSALETGFFGQEPGFQGRNRVADASSDGSTMSTTAKRARFQQQMAKLEANKKAPDKVKLRPRDKIRIRLRCRLCGRPRAVYRKFGICRICFRKLADQGLIPGVRKASW